MGSWSYEILGNDDIFDFLNNFIYICASDLTDEEYERFGEFEKFEDIPLIDRQYVIENNYDKLVKAVKDDPRMDGFIALGVFITQNGAKLTKQVKQLILNNVVDEDDQFYDLSGWETRKKHLDDFRKIISEYDGSPHEYKSTSLFETLSDHVKKLRRFKE